MKTYTPLDVDQETTLLNNHYEETTSSNTTNLLCFNIFCFGRNNKRGHGQPHNTQGEKQESWLVKKLKSLKATSEVVAGPKWKNLLRKMGRYFRPKKPTCQFQYDPESYQHNFDHGGRDEEDSMMHAFSSRFAPPQCKLSSSTN